MSLVTYHSLSFQTQQRQLPDKWQHDKFVGEVKSSSLMISNLDFGVSGIFINPQT